MDLTGILYEGSKCKYLHTSLNVFIKGFSEAFPNIESATIDLAKDFELPGLPIKKRGILNSIQIAIIKTFSLRAAFLAMFWPNFMLSKRTY